MPFKAFWWNDGWQKCSRAQATVRWNTGLFGFCPRFLSLKWLIISSFSWMLKLQRPPATSLEIDQGRRPGMASPSSSDSSMSTGGGGSSSSTSISSMLASGTRISLAVEWYKGPTIFTFPFGHLHWYGIGAVMSLAMWDREWAGYPWGENHLLQIEQLMERSDAVTYHVCNPLWGCDPTLLVYKEGLYLCLLLGHVLTHHS